MSSRLEIVEVITRMAWFADRRDRDALAGVFAGQVRLDYTSLNGGEPVTLSPDQVVAGWRAGLDGHYLFELGHSDATGWLIGAITMTTTWATGNREIMRLAAGIS